MAKGLGYKEQPEEKVIKTLIHGVKSSGNQAERERGVRETARISAEEYPKVNQIVQNDIYLMTACQKKKMFKKL